MAASRSKLTIAKILAWADAHRRRTGAWPAEKTGRVVDTPGWTWQSIDQALRRGFYDLKGGDTLTRLLIRRRNKYSDQFQPDLTPAMILKWADAHHRRTGKWPKPHDRFRIVGTRHEKWSNIHSSLAHANRGLPGKDTLSRFLARHGRIEYDRRWMRGRVLKLSDIREWAEAYRRERGVWPGVKSGAVREADGETWGTIDQAMRHGYRGLSKGGSLARLLGKRPRTPSNARRPRLSVPQILAWADDHFRQADSWPFPDSGPINAAPDETWAAVDTSLKKGFRGLRTKLTLRALLARERDIPFQHKQHTPLSERQILHWADMHFRRTKGWPKKTSGRIGGAPGENWYAVDAALVKGTRGLPGDVTLARLLARERGVRNVHGLASLSEAAILRWADAYHRRTGHWPQRNSGPIPEAPGETWGFMADALHRGARGLSGRRTLTVLLMEERGVENAAYQSRLSEHQILLWARAYARRTGEWPDRLTGKVVDAPGELWINIDKALYRGFRGLPGGQTLRRMLAGRRKPPPLIRSSSPRLVRRER